MCVCVYDYHFAVSIKTLALVRVCAFEAVIEIAHFML